MTRTHPLGPVREGAGHRFSVFSRHAEGMTLALFDERGVEERVSMERSGDIFTVYVPRAAVGQAYGFRAEGRYAPWEGHRFQPSKLLLDPYARRVDGAFSVRGELFDFHQNEQDPDTRDSAAHVPRSVVVDHAFDWGHDRAPRTPWGKTVLYEAHVKGLTRSHPLVPAPHRGTFLGLVDDAVLDHLEALGVTAIELLPIQQGVLERHLAARAMPNYWGYNTIAPFAPDSRFAVLDPVRELKMAVKRLHARGFEIILDIVFNHTGEGDDRGTTVGLRGLDGPSYYRHANGKLVDWTGTGNTLDLGNPAVRSWVLDCLRAWVTDYHIDGFRFDLGVCLGREHGPFDPQASLLRTMLEDPVLSQVKRIVEPWDLGPDGYQAGRFPEGFVEWNGEYRDAVRRFFRSDGGRLGELASRLCGSSDRYAVARGPLASVSFVTAHDGFTLRDLVSYDRKHNEPNGEHNRDGHDPSYSRSFGHEGETDDGGIQARRLRVAKSIALTLAVSQGVPMILGGDELWRTQQGNNNAYCQDHPGVYTKWDSKSHDVTELLHFFRSAFWLRRVAGCFGRERFFDGSVDTNGSPDIRFLSPNGQPMREADWRDPNGRALALELSAQLPPRSALVPPRELATDLAVGPPPDAQPRPGSLLVLLNGGDEPVTFHFPRVEVAFSVVLSTDCPPDGPRETRRSLLVLPGGSAVVAATENG